MGKVPFPNGNIPLVPTVMDQLPDGMFHLFAVFVAAKFGEGGVEHFVDTDGRIVTEYGQAHP